MASATGYKIYYDQGHVGPDTGDGISGGTQTQTVDIATAMPHGTGTVEYPNTLGLVTGAFYFVDGDYFFVPDDDTGFPPNEGGTVTSYTYQPGQDGIVEGSDGDDIFGAGYTEQDIDGDWLDGVDGDDDIINVGDGDDWVAAGAGNDTVYGGSGNDTLTGGEGGDTIDGGTGNDTIHGDGLFYSPSAYASTSEGAEATLNITNSANGPVDVYWIDGTGNSIYFDTLGPGESASYASFEDHNWVLKDSDGFSVKLIEGGNQTVDYGADGLDDTIFGGTGEDTIRGQFGDDTISGNDGDDTIYGGSGVARDINLWNDLNVSVVGKFENFYKISFGIISASCVAGSRPQLMDQTLLFVQGMHSLSRSEEHTSELQSLTNLVCRLLLEKKKKKKKQKKKKTKQIK